MFQISLLLMKSLNKTETHISAYNVFFISKGNLIDFNWLFLSVHGQ